MSEDNKETDTLDEEIDTLLGEETSETTEAPDDDEVIVISRALITNIGIAGVFLLLGFVLGGLFGTGILVNNSDVVTQAIVDSAPEIAQGSAPAQQQAQAPQPTQPPAVVENVSVDDDPYLGPEDAPVTIVEFSDFRCGFCGRFYQQTFNQIMEDYEGQVRFVYRDYMAVGGQLQAEAAQCAYDQNAFWEYHDELFIQQNQHNTEDDLVGLAAELGLDEEAFRQCLETDKYREEVQADMADGQEYGVTGTPTFFINGRRVVGAQPYSVFQQVIDQALEEAETGG